jgi:hypothetical protein
VSSAALEAWVNAVQTDQRDDGWLSAAVRGHPAADSSGWLPAAPVLADSTWVAGLVRDLQRLVALISAEATARCGGDPSLLVDLLGVHHRVPTGPTAGSDRWLDHLRADLVLGPSGWYLCEVNVDSALSGAAAAAAATTAHLRGPIADRLRADGLRCHAPDYFAMKARALTAWAPRRGRVAVVGVVEPGEPYPDAVFDDEVRGLTRHGFHASRHEPRELHVADGRLRDTRGDPFDLAIRYYVPRVAERLGVPGDHLERIESTWSTGWFVPRAANAFASKRLLAWLWEGALAGRPGYEVVRERVPFTVEIADRTVTLADGCSVHLPDHLLADRAGYVLKPVFEMGGRGVVIGAGVDDDVWSRAVASALSGNQPTVAQRYIPPATFTVPAIRAGEILHRDVTAAISPFLVGGSYAGALCRLAPAHLAGPINWQQELMYTSMVAVERAR